MRAENRETERSQVLQGLTLYFSGLHIHPGDPGLTALGALKYVLSLMEKEGMCQ